MQGEDPPLDGAGSSPVRADCGAPAPDRERGRAAAGAEVGVVHARAFVDPARVTAARLARRAPTPAEALAWELLRGRRCLGLKFRREQVIEGFRVDFYCASLRLSIEVDGGVHDEADRREYDALRTQALQALSIRVLRVRNECVSRETFERMLTAP